MADRTEWDAGTCATAAETRREATFTLHTEADQPDRITVDWPDGLPSMTLGREAVERMVGNINDLRAEVHRLTVNTGHYQREIVANRADTSERDDPFLAIADTLLTDALAKNEHLKARVQSDDLRIAGLLTDLAESHRAHETTRRELAHITAHMHREAT